MFKLAIPEELGIPDDTLMIRIDVFSESIVLTDFCTAMVKTKMVSAHDIATSFVKELTFNSGFLPENTLWWKTTKFGPVHAVYVNPQIRTISLIKSELKKPQRYLIPLPPLIFLCIPCRSPWVYAVKERPQSENDVVYKAPFYNVYSTGYTCGGSNRYPSDPQGIIEMFLNSFFSPHLASDGRVESGITMEQLWKKLRKKPSFPLDELVKHGTIKDLINQNMENERA